MPYYEQLQTLISAHLEDIEHNRLPVIARRTGYSIDLIQEAPRGTAQAESEAGGRLQRDVRAAGHARRVRRAGRRRRRTRCGWKTAARPASSSAPTIASCSPAATLTEETREYIKRKINSAQWLIDSIEQRRNTLTKVAQAIVDHQTEFLDKGPEFIEPLKMQQIADKVGVHVTTVSRAVDDKWIQTPRGIFPLKRFFCGGTMSADGEEVAWDTIRLKLQEIDRQGRQAAPVERRSTRQGTGRPGHHGGPAHGDQVSQGHEHSQFASAPRLGRDAVRRRAAGGLRRAAEARKRSKSASEDPSRPASFALHFIRPPSSSAGPAARRQR